MTANAGAGGNADISDLGSNIIIPCINGPADIASNKDGKVTITITNCDGVADVIGTLASNRGTCTGNTCTLNFGDNAAGE